MKPENAKITPEQSARPSDIPPSALSHNILSAPSIDMPSEVIVTRAGRAFANTTLRFQFIYSIVGLVLGLFSMAIGGFLCLSGVAGHSNLSAKLLGAATELSDAAPGTVLFVVGLLVVVATRFKVRLHNHDK